MFDGPADLALQRKKDAAAPGITRVEDAANTLIQ
jgi:hypothetical protein